MHSTNILLIIVYGLLVVVLLLSDQIAIAATFSALAVVFLKGDSKTVRYSKIGFLTFSVALLLWMVYVRFS